MDKGFFMKKILFLFCILIAYTSFSQAQFKYVIKKYFRTHPLEMKFSSFILSLHKDPWFTIDEENRRTDSTFFYLRGTYKNYNPLQYTPKELRLVIAEMQIVHEDSLKTLDTIMSLQLMGIADSSVASKKMVEKEFKRFHNNHADRFSNNNYNSYKSKDGDIVAEIHNYFVSPFAIAPITIAWGVQTETHQYLFTITLRFKVNENHATFIMSPEQLLD
jgi:hypothetical protein